MYNIRVMRMFSEKMSDVDVRKALDLSGEPDLKGVLRTIFGDAAEERDVDKVIGRIGSAISRKVSLEGRLANRKLDTEAESKIAAVKLQRTAKEIEQYLAVNRDCLDEWLGWVDAHVERWNTIIEDEKERRIDVDAAVHSIISRLANGFAKARTEILALVDELGRQKKIVAGDEKVVPVPTSSHTFFRRRVRDTESILRNNRANQRHETSSVRHILADFADKAEGILTELGMLRSNAADELCRYERDMELARRRERAAARNRKRHKKISPVTI